MAVGAEEKLITEERLFLSLLRCAVHGETMTEAPEADWSAVFSLASRHHVLPMVLEAAYACPGVPEALLARAQGAAMSAVISQAMRTRTFLSLYRDLASQGLSPAVVKGIVCRSLYPQPDHRPSSDEDLLAAAEDLAAVHAFFLSRGMASDPAKPEEGVQEITYSGSGVRIELHTSLFPEDSEAYGELNRLFDGAIERTVASEIYGVTVRTLSPTDHMLYLLCHAYKHFLHAGVGIRQICDMCLLARANPEIDWLRIYEGCQWARMECFAAALFRIGEKHLGFETPEVFSRVETDEGALLKDILSAGVYGTTEDIDRVHSSGITLEAVAAQRQKRRNKGLAAQLFPKREYMERQYPYVKEHGWLLPAAWLQRIVRYTLRRGDLPKGDPAESVRIGRERVALLREYGIID